MGLVPPILYKYRNWIDPDGQLFQQRIITENEIYLASASQFNDPFDCALPYRYRQEDLDQPDKLFQKLMETGRRLFPDLSENQLMDKVYDQQFSGRFENGQYWKEDYERSLNEIYANFGIISLTQKRNNLLMWSHYAGSHTGYCVGFDTGILHAVIQGTIDPVEYSTEFPLVELVPENSHGLTKILLTKSTDWSYEEECRLVKIGITKQTVNLPAEAIVEVMLGYKMEENLKDIIMKIVREKFPHARLFQMQMSFDRFELLAIPILNFQAP